MYNPSIVFFRVIGGRVLAGIGLISNPKSRKNKKDPARLERLKHILPDVSLARNASDLGTLKKELTFFKERKIDILAVNGGDGTLHVTISHLINIYGDTPLPKIAILRGGTMNTVALNLDVKGNTFKILKNLARKYESGSEIKTIKKSLVKAGNKYGFIFVNGFACNFLDEYHKGGDPSPWVAAKTIARTIGSSIIKGRLYKYLTVPFDGQITVDDKPFEKDKYMLVFISCLKKMGLGFETLYKADDSETEVHMMGFKDRHGIVGIIPLLPSAFKGKPMPPDKVDDMLGRTFVFESDKNFRYTLDGDLYSSTGRLVIESGPVVELITEL